MKKNVYFNGICLFYYNRSWSHWWAAALVLASGQFWWTGELAFGIKQRSTQRQSWYIQRVFWLKWLDINNNIICLIINSLFICTQDPTRVTSEWAKGVVCLLDWLNRWVPDAKDQLASFFECLKSPKNAHNQITISSSSSSLHFDVLSMLNIFFFLNFLHTLITFSFDLRVFIQMMFVFLIRCVNVSVL